MKRLSNKRLECCNQFGKGSDQKPRPIFCRIGSKWNMSNIIISNFPKHQIYVEPFFGGGGVYWKKNKSNKEIVNDIETSLIDDYKLIKEASDDKNDYRKDLDTIFKQTQFIQRNNITPENKLTEAIIRRCNGYGSRYIPKNSEGGVFKNPNPYRKLENIKYYKDRIKNTKFYNDDYKYIIKKYDSPETLFYLDPPYIGSEEDKIYIYSNIDYKEMANILKEIKGEFVLSLKSTPEILNIFKNFKIKKIQLKTNQWNKNELGGKPRTELLIMK